MIHGLIEGYAVANWDYANHCTDCPVRFEGSFKHSNPVKGIVTLGDGRKADFDAATQNETMSPEMNNAFNDYVVTQMLGFTMEHMFDLSSQ